MEIQIKCSDAIGGLTWGAAFGLVTVTDVNRDELERKLSKVRTPVEAGDTQALERVSRCITAFDRFFAENGFTCPLGQQLELTRRKGLPQANALVRALLFAEMSTGLLMGAQDASAMNGALIYDLAKTGEKFQGMRNEIECHNGEIVLRDDEGIVASLFQGPDHRTRLKKETANVVFFVFSCPGIPVTEVKEGTEMIKDIFVNASSGSSAQLLERGAPVPADVVPGETRV